LVPSCFAFRVHPRLGFSDSNSHRTPGVQPLYPCLVAWGTMENSKQLQACQDRSSFGPDYRIRFSAISSGLPKSALAQPGYQGPDHSNSQDNGADYDGYDEEDRLI